MKTLIVIFAVLIALLQYPLWLGKGSWKSVWDLNQQIDDYAQKNQMLKMRNETLDAEVRDLKSGKAAIEERARSELGMIKQNEVFYQVLDNPLQLQPSRVLPADAVPATAPAASTAPLSNSPSNIKPE